MARFRVDFARGLGQGYPTEWLLRGVRWGMGGNVQVGMHRCVRGNQEAI